MDLKKFGKALLGGTGKAARHTGAALGSALSTRATSRVTSPGATFDIEPSAKTFYDAATNTIIQIVGLIAPLLIACVLTMGNGYFFSGFHEWTFADPLIVWAYIGGGVLEAIGLGLVYRAARRYRKGDYRGMMFTLVWLLVLMSISVFAQYMFLQGLYTTGTLKVPDNAVEHAPLFSWLVGVGGMQGHDIVFFVRALAFHIGEIACSFVVVDKAKTASQIIAERREIHDAHIALERQNLQLQRERDEAEQDGQIKRLQHEWLLQQVRRGVTVTPSDDEQDALPSPKEDDAVTGHIVQLPISPLQQPRLDTASQPRTNGQNGK